LEKHYRTRIRAIYPKKKLRRLGLISRSSLRSSAARERVEQLTVQFIGIGGKPQGRSKQGIEAEPG
jgi:hypothetical protein